MKKQQQTGLSLIGRSPQSGITIYEKNGKRVVRSAFSTPSRRCTRKQFEQRMRMRHSIALWHRLAEFEPMFTEHQSAYSGFISLANRLPAVFVTKDEASHNVSFLMPDIPVSEGTLMSIKQHLGEVSGVAALITNLKKEDLRPGDALYLYTAEQHNDYNYPKTEFSVRKITKRDMTYTDNGLALVGEEFANTSKGWTLVLVRGKRCTTQGLVTNCTFYQQYTTPEAMVKAAEDYSSRKMKIVL